MPKLNRAIEEEIRKDVLLGASIAEMSENYGVGDKTLRDIRIMLRTVMGMRHEDVERIRKMLLNGYSVSLTSARLSVHLYTVRAVRRFHYILATDSVSRNLCDACKEPIRLYDPNEDSFRPRSPDTACVVKMASQFYSLVHDMEELAKLELTANPLFLSLTVRAGELLNAVEAERDENEG